MISQIIIISSLNVVMIEQTYFPDFFFLFPILILLCLFCFFSFFCIQARQVEDLLLKVQPEMKTDLLRGVQKFQIDTAGFYKEYDEK